MATVPLEPEVQPEPPARAPALFASRPGSRLDQVLSPAWLSADVLLWVGLIAVSIIAHLWALDRMALHHDESIHAWMSWKFYSGKGGDFSCVGGRSSATYCYDPVYHGPALYVFTLLSYFLFGDGEWQARLPEAICGILLTASCWWLRPYLGRRGALIAAALVTLSPTILYFTRFARHDGLIILWTFWMVIGFFRYLDSGRRPWLLLLAAGAALAVATHELYYILFFLFGSFVVIRLLDENGRRRPLAIGLIALTAIAVVLEVWNPRITPTLTAAGMAFLLMTVALGGLLVMRLWDSTPVLTPRLAALWRADRGGLWVALGLFALIYTLLYSTFFANPRGIVDGAYQGLNYWLGSQQEFKRGDQPWYYYLMQLSIYEPLGFFGAIATAVGLYARRGRSLVALPGREARNRQAAKDAKNQAEDQDELSEAEASRLATLAERRAAVSVPLFPLFLAFWFVGALVAFSWAGEKMPWLTIHIALPGNLLVAWGLGRLLDRVLERPAADRRVWLVPGMLTLTLVLLGVALWRMTPDSSGQQAQASLLQGLVPLVLAGGLIYVLLMTGARAGRGMTLALCGLTLAGLLGAYTVRSAWTVNYRQPDVPREFLVYVQNAPDVPLIVRELKELAITQTRNIRTETDPTGGLSMPVIMDTGDASGEGSLSWPFQFYLRDFQRVENRNADFFSKATAESFLVDAPGGGEKVAAPVVMVATPHVTESTRAALEQGYVLRYNTTFNWWFPEGNKCAPNEPGYKRFYYSSGDAEGIARGCGATAKPADFGSILAPFGWALSPANWGTIGRYLIFREIPQPLQISRREMQVWVRKDLAPRASEGGGTSVGGDPTVKLLAQQALTGGDAAPLNQPRGLAVDSKGNVYVAELGSHTIRVFGPDGKVLRTIGGLGAAPGQLNEPRGLAVDQQGNLYVADTWNARISKFGPDGGFIKSWGVGDADFGAGRRATITDGTEAGNAAKPLGFFGPRGVAVDQQGNVYIADTGNKRIVVTDTDGNYRYQFGQPGAAPGQFNEPIGVAVDQQGNVLVADTWNGRVQVFPRNGDRVAPQPSATWKVPGWQPSSYDDPYIAAGPAGQVYVTVPGRSQAIYASPSGDLLLRWGGKGGDLGSLNFPSGIAVGPNGSVYIADRDNARVVSFAIPAIAVPAGR